MQLLIHLKLAVDRFKCASAYIHAYNLLHLIFAVLERRLPQHWIDWIQFFIYNNCVGVFFVFERPMCAYVRAVG